MTNGKEMNISERKLDELHGEKSMTWGRIKSQRNEVVSSNMYTKETRGNKALDYKAELMSTCAT